MFDAQYSAMRLYRTMEEIMEEEGHEALEKGLREGHPAIQKEIETLRTCAPGNFKTWNPIATAPKDETPILALNSDYLPLVLEWDDEAEDPDFPWATLDGPYYHKNWPILWAYINLPKE